MKISRLNAIEEYVLSKKTVSIDELCEVFSVSKNTIRRDLNELEARGLFECLPLEDRQMRRYFRKTTEIL